MTWLYLMAAFGVMAAIEVVSCLIHASIADEILEDYWMRVEEEEKKKHDQH